MKTLILNGAGPHLKIKSGANSKVLLIGKTKTKTINLGKTSEIKFAA